MRIPDPKANTTTEAYLAYKAGYLEESELKPKLYEPYLHFDAWLAYWAGLTNTYPLDKNGDPEMLTDEEALVAYLSGVTDTYPEEIKDPYDVRIVGYLKHLASIRWPEPDYPVNNEEFYLSTMEPTHTSNSVPSSDIELDTVEGKIIDVEAYGDTTQTTYSGKNKMPMADADMTGEVEADRNKTFRMALPAGTYTISFDLDSFELGTNTAFGVYMQIYASSAKALIDLAIINITSTTGTGRKTVTFTINEDATTDRSDNIRIASTSWNNGARSKISNIQIESGSTATDYEPYVGGTPAPNPSYPQPISVVTGEQTVKVVGKNLFSGEWSQFNNIGGIGTLYYYFKLPTDGDYTLTLKAKNDIDVQSSKFIGFTREGGSANGGFVWAWSVSSTATKDEIKMVQNSVGGNQLGYLSIFPKTEATLEWFMENFDIQLEQGSTATPYQAYTEQDYAISLTGKNLFNKVTSTAGYRIDSNGDPYANASYFISDYIAVQPSTTYAYSRGAAGSGLATIAYYKSDKTFISRTMPTIGSSDTSGTVTTPNNAYYARFCDINEVLDSTQLELGATATEYEAYSPLELAKIGTYQDRIYKEGDKWYIEKQVGKVVLDGTPTDVVTYSNYGLKANVYAIRAFISDIVDGNTSLEAMSDKYHVYGTGSWADWYQTAPNITLGDMSKNSDGKGVLISAPHSENTQTLALAWLANNPAILYYQLATPTTTEITNQSLIDQLDALAGADTYNVKTYIKVTATEHNLPALLKVEAYKY